MLDLPHFFTGGSIGPADPTNLPRRPTQEYAGECAPVSVFSSAVFWLCFTHTHEVTAHFLCLYSPKSNLVEKVRAKCTINSTGRLWQIVLELADQYMSLLFFTSRHLVANENVQTAASRFHT